MALVDKTKNKPTPETGGSRSSLEDTRHLGFEPIKPPRWFSTPPFPKAPETAASPASPSPPPPAASAGLAQFPVLLRDDVILPPTPPATVPPRTPVFSDAPAEPRPAPAATPAVIIPADTPAVPAMAAGVTTAPFVTSIPAAITVPVATAAPASVPLSRTASRGTSISMSVTALTRLLKLSLSIGIVLGIIYFSAKNAIPFLKELANPSASTAPGKNDSVGVKVLKQTRGVIAKNDANVASLDAIIASEDPNYKPIPLPDLPAQPEKLKPVAPKPVEAPKVVVDFKKLNRSISDLQINGVIGGKKPRIVVGGLLVHLGEVVDPNLGLKFVALDESKRLILLANDADVVFPKSY